MGFGLGVSFSTISTWYDDVVFEQGGVTSDATKANIAIERELLAADLDRLAQVERSFQELPTAGIIHAKGPRDCDVVVGELLQPEVSRGWKRTAEEAGKFRDEVSDRLSKTGWSVAPVNADHVEIAKAFDDGWMAHGSLRINSSQWSSGGPIGDQEIWISVRSFSTSLSGDGVKLPCTIEMDHSLTALWRELFG